MGSCVEWSDSEFHEISFLSYGKLWEFFMNSGTGIKQGPTAQR